MSVGFFWKKFNEIKQNTENNLRISGNCTVLLLKEKERKMSRISIVELFVGKKKKLN